MSGADLWKMLGLLALAWVLRHSLGESMAEAWRRRGRRPGRKVVDTRTGSW